MHTTVARSEPIRSADEMANMTRKRKVAGPDRGRAYSGRALRTAVRRVCLDEFERTFGFPWDKRLEGQKYGRGAANEREARRVFSNLKDAMDAAVGYVHRHADGKAPPAGGQCSQYLRWWVPEFIEPLTKHAAIEARLDPARWGKIVDNNRALFIERWTNLNMLSLPEGRFLSTRELAVISLLSGGWPSANPHLAYTSASVIALEEKLIRKLTPVHAKFWRGPGGRDYHRDAPCE